MIREAKAISNVFIPFAFVRAFISLAGPLPPELTAATLTMYTVYAIRLVSVVILVVTFALAKVAPPFEISG